MLEMKREKEELALLVEAERVNAKKYHAQLQSKTERLKYLEKQSKSTPEPSAPQVNKSEPMRPNQE
jgi:hypothetical protein